MSVRTENFVRHAARLSGGLAAMAWALFNAGAAFAQSAAPAQPAAPAAAPEAPVGEIIVTAQKRAQGVNSVPMSITAATGAQLAQAGIRTVSDLVKITPGLTFGVSTAGTPVYTLRGVGYNDVSPSARPAVTVYLDEAPIPFAIESKGASLDVERVEVLKGPQGTLFGSNSTGGAINYVANKPTATFQAGGSATYGAYDEFDVDGYVSGPLTDTLSARIAVEHRGMGDWQRSYTSGATRGKQDFNNGRFSLLWKPRSDLRAELTVSRWVDRSDTQAAQAIAIVPQSPDYLAPTGLAGYPLAPASDRAADWIPGRDYAQDNRFLQVSARVDYDLTSQITLTSLSNYIDYKDYQPTDGDGVAVDNITVDISSQIKSYSQELRATGKFGALNAVLGGFYSHDTSVGRNFISLYDSTVAYSLGPVTGTNFNTNAVESNDHTHSYAVFANAEYKLSDTLTLQGGARYTRAVDDFTGCSADVGDGNAAAVFGTLFGTTIAPGQCFTLNVNTGVPGPVVSQLDEHNVSWRGGIQYKPSQSTLVYANVSKGYKAGGYPSITATTSPSLAPAVQESVLGYEAGFKTALFDRAVQLNGAAFYYDYRDKQVVGTAVVPGIGAIAKLVNVPKSRIYGAEFQLSIRPIHGFSVNTAGSYINSAVLDHYTSTNAVGATEDFQGTALPFVPKWQLNGNLRYERMLRDRLRAFGSASLTYQSQSFSDLGEVPLTQVNAHALLDLQAGVEAPDGSWRAYAWGRNVTNTYYWYNTARVLDTAARFTGMPATYGVTLAFKYR